MESIKRILKFLNIDLKSSVLSFWLVMIILNIASCILNARNIIDIDGSNIYLGLQISGGDFTGAVSYAGANIFPMLVFYTVFAYVSYYEDMPIVIGFSGTRNDFFNSVLIQNTVVAAIFSAVQTMLLKIDLKLIENLGRKAFVDFKMFNSQNDNIIFIFLSIFLISICFLGFANLLASSNYKFGYKMWIFLAIVFGIIMPHLNIEIFYFLFDILSERMNLINVVILLITTIIVFGSSWLMVKNVNIKAKLA